MKKIFKFLDHPNMWMVYLILGSYLFYAGISVLVGVRKYNLVLDLVEQKKIATATDINSELSKCGFRIIWGQNPKLMDYLYAGL